MSTALTRNRMAYQSRIPKNHMRRSIFPAKWNRKQTMYASYITPIMCKKVIPGTTMNINLTEFMRLNTQVTCPIDNLQVETFFFYCPERIVWDNANYFIGAVKDPNASPQPDYLVPQVEIPASANTAGSLFNLLSGSRIGKKVKVSDIPFRIHNEIYNEYFRDGDCESPKVVNRGDADGTYTNYDLYRIHKSRDYFTNSTRDIVPANATPVTLPLGTTAELMRKGSTERLNVVSKNSSDVQENVRLQAIGEVNGQNRYVYGLDGGALSYGANGSELYLPRTEILDKLQVNLSTATAATITALRQAIMTEEYQEALNRAGSGKYVDVMRSIYQQDIPDLTLQRPKYLGGTSAPFFTNPVVQTSGTGISSQDTPQGNIAGFGTNTDGGNVINASFQEFGWVIGYAVVKAQPQYQQGLNREWTEKDKFDYFNPFYCALSDQPIKKGEIYLEDYDATDSDGNIKNDATFGYIGRYDQYRYFKNEIAGELNSEYQYTLDSWHYAEKFENSPENNADFMADKTNEILDRSMAVVYEVPPTIEDGVVTDEGIKAPQIIADFYFDGFVSLPIPTHPVPKISSQCI